MEIIVFDSGIKQPEDRGILLRDILEDRSEKIGRMVGSHLVNGKRVDLPDMRGKTTQRLEPRKNQKSGTLPTVQKDNLVIKNKSNTVRSSGRGSNDHHEWDRVYKVNRKGDLKTNQDKASCLTAGGHSGGNHSDMDLLKKGDSYRRLTPVECERLQTYPDNWTEGVSKTQRFKILGNSFTVEVIAHILRQKDNGSPQEKDHE